MFSDSLAAAGRVGVKPCLMKFLHIRADVRPSGVRIVSHELNVCIDHLLHQFLKRNENGENGYFKFKHAYIRRFLRTTLQ